MSFIADPVRERYLKALSAYIKKAEGDGYTYHQPAEDATVFTPNTVRLHNCKGLLAVYNSRTGKIKI